MLFECRSSPQRGVAIQPDIARQTRARRLRQRTRFQRFHLRRLDRAARSKARREQIIADGEPPPGSRGEPGSTAPSVPLRPAHSPWRSVHAKCDRGFCSSACRTHVCVALDVVFCSRDRDDPGRLGCTPGVPQAGMTRSEPQRAATIRFSPIGKSAARLIVLPIAAGV